MKARQIFYISSIVVVAGISLIALRTPSILWSFIIILPLISVGVYDAFQTKHTIRKNFPLIGNIRYMLEKIRPEIMQYFVEKDTEGKPFNRLHRTLIYERATKQNDTTPFGTQLNVYNAGYEWMEHSIYAKNHDELNRNPRVLVGGKDCLQPYSASILNISAMSFGSLSKNAVLAMNTGAKKGNFAHNTGEGGISSYHKTPGGDLIWQIGTGYFGCRTKAGEFSSEKFKENATIDQVKMIEVKLSQGAKPGHGGMLPAVKNTKEIAAIRGIEPHTEVLSPPGHSAFNTPKELMFFIKKLRDLSGGKPVGFKLCIGKKSEFRDLCIAMLETGIKPDFISIDGGEGGTGSAPLEFSNSVGSPLRDGLIFAIDTLIGYDLKKDIKVIASGKVFTSFHMVRLIAIGADMVNSARAMMMATGCIQALKCNDNSCPVGVATQNKRLMKGLDVQNKAERVFNYHDETVENFVDLLAASGILEPSELKREHMSRRVEMNEVLTYADIYPEVTPGQLLETKVAQSV